MLLPFLAKTNFRYYIVGLILSVALLGVFTGIDNGKLFKASTLNSISHEPFDGTVYPFSHSMDWVNMTSAEREMSFNQIPDSKKIAPLRYDASHLGREFASLSFDGEDRDIRNEKITYTVAYMGDYTLSGKEYTGSHAAVDIVMPVRTPIVAIANGIVTQVKDQSYGFGKSVVVMHRGVPDPSGGGTTTLYSSYSHLNEIDAEEFQIVRKGDIIGYSGNTGNATVAHTHFQIDREEAPWYPYWPFTASEQKAAGYDFVTAVNNGLGASNGVKYTVHPMKFVQEHLSGVTPAAREEVKEVVEEKAEEVEEPKEEVRGAAEEPESVEAEETVEEEVEEVVEPAEVEKVVSDHLPKVNVIAPRKMLVGQEYEIKITVYNLDNEFASSASNNYKFRPTLLGDYSLPRELDFSRDVVFPFTPKETGDLDINIEMGGITAAVKNIEVKLFTDLSVNDKDLKAISYLKNKGIISGYGDNTYKPENLVTRGEAVKILTSVLPGDYADLGNIACNDLPTDAWYREYFEKAYDIGAVSPSDFGACRPLDQVNGYEYLKMLMTKVDVDPKVDNVYSEYFDVDTWYAPYLQEALERNVITSQDAVDYAQPLSRREVAELTYRFLQVAESNYDVFS